MKILAVGEAKRTCRIGARGQGMKVCEKLGGFQAERHSMWLPALSPFFPHLCKFLMTSSL